jgi:Effector-associated domain 10/NACHT domain
MKTPDELIAIFDRVLQGNSTLEEKSLLRQWLRMRGGLLQVVNQDGKFNTNIGQVHGGEIQIGDRIYQGNDAETIKTALRDVLQEAKSAQRPRNQNRLLKTVKHEVNARLQQSLHNAVLINLGKEKQAEQVRRNWDAEVKIGTKPNGPIPNTTSILEVFDYEEIAGKLLILGNPGCGKTTTQLELAKALIERAETNSDIPIPVLFNLSTWKAVRSENQPSIQEWLITELKSRYGVRVDLGRKWFNDGLLLPMLDGLDELESDRQKPCVQAINQLLKENPSLYLVVCSRRQEYEQLETKLYLNGAVCIQPLTNSQIQYYLEQVGFKEYTSTILSDSALCDLLSSPFLLSISVLAYQGISVEMWKSLNSSDERLQYLFSVYVQQMLMRPIRPQFYQKRTEPKPEQTLYWLTWLAQQLKDNAQTEFVIEKMQPVCLTQVMQRWEYRILLAIMGMAVLIVPFFSLVAFRFQLNRQGVVILFSALMMGMLLDWYRDIKPIETLRVSWRIPRKRLQIGLRNGLLFGFAGWLIGLGIPTPANNGGMIGGIVGGLSATIVGCIDGELIGPEIDIKTYPNQGIYRSAMNAAIVALSFATVFALVGILKGNTNLAFSLGLIGAVSGNVVGGGLACLQHFTLRLILWCHGAIPWNYARFLNHANERIFLQRVGGHYRFIHDLLREYFASGQAIQSWRSHR